jgi:nicotinamidase/pyrazinamidase
MSEAVFIDVDTQLDFLQPAGALTVPGAESITGALATLTRFAAAHGISILSTTVAHTENDPEFKVWKPHCVAGTLGQQKVVATQLPQPLVLSSVPGAFESVADGVPTARQIVIQKQNVDCFTNPNLRPLLALISAKRYVVYGVFSEVCVRHAAFGLLAISNARVEIVTDAIKSIDGNAEREMLRLFESQGGHLTTVAAVTSDHPNISGKN